MMQLGHVTVISYYVIGINTMYVRHQKTKKVNAVSR